LAHRQFGLPQVTRILVREPSMKGFPLVKFFIAAFRLVSRTLMDIPFSFVMAYLKFKDFNIMRTYTYNILNKKSKREENFFTKILFQEKLTRRKFDFLSLLIFSEKNQLVK
jgi:hypothetical protein